MKQNTQYCYTNLLCDTVNPFITMSVIVEAILTWSSSTMNNCTFCTFFLCFHLLDRTSHFSAVVMMIWPLASNWGKNKCYNRALQQKTVSVNLVDNFFSCLRQMHFTLRYHKCFFYGKAVQNPQYKLLK